MTIDDLCDAYDSAKIAKDRAIASFTKEKEIERQAKPHPNPPERESYRLAREEFSGALNRYYSASRALSEAMFSLGIDKHTHGRWTYISSMSVDPCKFSDGPPLITRVMDESPAVPV